MLNLKGARGVRDSYAHGQGLSFSNNAAGGDVWIANPECVNQPLSGRISSTKWTIYTVAHTGGSASNVTRSLVSGCVNVIRCA